MMRCGSVGLILLAAACFVIGAVAVAIPYWGHFRNRVVQETGNFGPWTICRDIDYGRKTCGQRIVMFKPSFRVYAAGVLSALGVAALGVYGLLTIFYMTLMCSPHSSLRRHKVYILITKLILSLIAALTAWTAVGLFATQGDDLEHGYILTVGVSFYMEIVVALFSTILMLLTIGEYVAARREPDDVGDSSQAPDIGLKNVITNPALAYSRGRGGGGGGDRSGGRHSPSSTNGISFTRASGLPHLPSLKYKYNSSSSPANNNVYVQQSGSRRYKGRPPPGPTRQGSGRRGSSRSKTPPSKSKPFGKDLPSPSWNGSASSIATSPAGSAANGAGNGSTVSDYSSVSTVSTVVSGAVGGFNRAGPLRSSLKKTSSRGGSESGFGISNPGFAGSSPTLSRSSSVKKVRIQSPMDVSTDV